MDLNMMMREQARTSLKAELDAAVVAGDSEAAHKVTAKIAALEVAAAPKAPAFGDTDIRAELDKQAWFGTDPKRSAKALEFGKTMDPKKFASAEAFAAAIVKAVDEEFPTKPAAGAGADDDDTDEDDGEEENDGEEEYKPAARKPRRSDGPGEGDGGGARSAPRRSGPWGKMSDAPANVQAEIKRQETRMLSSNASKEQRAAFQARALESHYRIHQQTKGKK